MPKTLPIAPPVDRRGRLVPVALFALAYVAILGVLFAPEGFFLSDPAGQPAALTTAD